MMRAAPLHTEGAEFRQQSPVPHPIEETQRPLSEASLQEKDMSRRRASVERSAEAELSRTQNCSLSVILSAMILSRTLLTTKSNARRR